MPVEVCTQLYYDVMTLCGSYVHGGPPPQKEMDNRSYSHGDRSNFHVETNISEYFDSDSEDDESTLGNGTWLTDE